MFTEGKLLSFSTHLEQFRFREQTRQSDLCILLKEYTQILSDYRELQQACDAKDDKIADLAAQAQMPAASHGEEQPFVLVLVDGNNYLFNDELILDKEEGGMRAARLLNEAVEKYIYQSIPQALNARIIVRIYADLTRLSKQLAKAGVTGMEKRSLGSFTAGFTRAFGLFDFVDALDEEGTELKIREQYELASKDRACTSIIFAACHDTTYLSNVAPFSGRRGKVTLVQSSSWNSSFNQFDLNVTQFPTVFRWSGLPNAAPSVKAIQPADATPLKSIVVTTRPALRTTSWRRDTPVSSSNSAPGSPELLPVRSHVSSNDTKSDSLKEKAKKPCRDFEKGNCRYGNKCYFAHLPGRKNSISSHTSSSIAPRPKHLDLIPRLPDEPPRGFVAVNSLNQRLDPYILPPTKEDWAHYTSRCKQGKPCNTFHLQQTCNDIDCPYDHSKLDARELHVMRYMLRGLACPRRGACRLGDCFFGHLCQKDGCEGFDKGCRIGEWGHGVGRLGKTLVAAEGEEPDFHDDCDEDLLL